MSEQRDGSYVRRLFRRPRVLALPAWAHGRQASGLPFVVRRCTRCGSTQIAVTVSDQQNEPEVRPCLGCLWATGERPEQRRAEPFEARAYVGQFASADLVTWR